MRAWLELDISTLPTSGQKVKIIYYPKLRYETVPNCGIGHCGKNNHTPKCIQSETINWRPSLWKQHLLVSGTCCALKSMFNAMMSASLTFGIRKLLRDADMS